MIKQTLFILSLIVLASAIRVQDAPDNFQSEFIDTSLKSKNPTYKMFLASRRLYCSLPSATVLTGVFWKEFGSSDVFSADPSNVRTSTFTVNFEQSFDEVPSVVVTLNGFDINTENAGVYVAAQDVTTTSFKIVVTAPVGARVYAVGASWLATVSAKTNIWVHNHKLSTETSKTLASFSHEHGPRTVDVKFKYTRRLINPGLAVAIAGFEFGSGRNLRLSLEPSSPTQTGFVLKASTWYDSIWEAASVAIVVFEEASDREVAITSTSVAGKLASGEGYREEHVSHKFATNINGPLWSGFSLLDAYVQANSYRLMNEITTSKNTASTKFWTWAETGIHLAKQVLLNIVPHGPEVVTRTGVFKKTYLGSGHPFESQKNVEQSETIWVPFPSAFSEVPSVGITISGIDMYYPNPGVRVFVEKVTTEGFSLKVSIFPNVILYMIHVNWIATISSKSGIHILTLKDDGNNPAFKKLSTNFYTERPIEYTFDYPRAMTNPAVTVGISGFSMNSNNARLNVYASSVEANKFKITVKTWYDTALYYIGATILVYEKDCLHGVFETKSAVTGVLYNGHGARVQNFEQSINIKDAITWTGISFVDLITGHNFRLTEEATVNGQKINAVMSTWWDTKVYQARANIFYTYPTR